MIGANIKNPFGLKDGKLIHISELSSSERGNSCNCICSLCKGPLNAKLGDINAHHFAHINSECKGSLESDLHIYAKELIESTKIFALPDILVDFGFTGRNENFIIESEHVKIDKAEIEQNIDNIKPDIIAHYGKMKILVEIAVTHFISEEKRESIQKLNLACIEIDLSGADISSLSKEELDEYILNNSENKTWINFPQKDSIIGKKIIKYKEQIFFDNLDQKKDGELIIKQAIEFSNYYKKHRFYTIEELLEFRESLKDNHNWKNICVSMGDINKNIKFINKPIEGEIIFVCHRLLWQGEIFRAFILNNTVGGIISLDRIITYINSHSGFFYNKDTEESVFNKKSIIEYKKIYSFSPVKKYLEKLVEEGILGKMDNNFYPNYRIRKYPKIIQYKTCDD